MHPDGRDDPGRADGRWTDSGRKLAWAPGFTDPEAPDLPDAGDADTPADELDLTVTPVSVTPPGTWRRAAWFAVGASCIVLTVLVFAAARLAGPDSPFDRIDAFPGPPTGGLLTAQPPAPPLPTEMVRPTADSDDDGTALGAPTSVDPGEPGVAGQPEEHQPGEEPGDPTRTRPATPSAADSRGESPAPTVSLLPSTGSPPVLAEDMLAATTRFYEAVPKDLNAAWDMVGPRVKVQGFEHFRKQWSQAERIHLQEVLVNTNASSVLTTVQFIRSDGSAPVRRFELIFRQGDPLVIDDIVPADNGNGGGSKPVG